MNVTQVIDLLRAGLDAAGHTTVPVVPPGTPLAKVPFVALAPGPNEMGDGNRSYRYGFDLTIAVPRGGQVTQYEYLCTLEAVCLRSLIPNQVRFDGPAEFGSTGGGDTGEPATLVRVIPVSFAADVTIC